jgi:hypothetical protein
MRIEPAMPRFHFDFEVTKEDLTKAFKIHETERLQIRTPFRWFIGFLALTWLCAGVLAALTPGAAKPFWLPVLWFALGAFLLFRFVIDPIMLRHEFMKNLEGWGKVLVDADNNQMKVSLLKHRTTTRDWSELAFILDSPGMTVLYFSDGSALTFPARAFTGTDQKEWFLTFLEGRRIMASD